MSNITVRDIQNLEEFSSFRLLAGAGGLDRIVSKCGILDYEYDREVRDKYAHTNFEKGQLALTSFLYAKHDEFLVMDAVKTLISRGCSALAIKNIFKLPIHESVLRYAESKNFPIFLIRDNRLFFEDIIYIATDLIRKHAALDWPASAADATMENAADGGSVVKMAKQLNPSFLSDLLGVFFYARRPFGPGEYLPLRTHIDKAELLDPHDSLFYYRNGLMLLLSSEAFTDNRALEIAKPYLDGFPCPPEDFFVGISDIQHSLQGLPQAMQQAICAALLHTGQTAGHTRYADLGSYQFVFAQAGSQQEKRYSERYLEPLRDYDAENGSQLFRTVLRFVVEGGELAATAAALAQHENTIRYRLNAAAKVLGTSPYSRAGYEEIALAAKIHICNLAAGHFNKSPYDWEQVLFPEIGS